MVLEMCRAAGLPVAVLMAGGYGRHVEDTVKIHTQTVRVAAGMAQSWRFGLACAEAHPSKGPRPPVGVARAQGPSSTSRTYGTCQMTGVWAVSAAGRRVYRDEIFQAKVPRAMPLQIRAHAPACVSGCDTMRR